MYVHLIHRLSNIWTYTWQHAWFPFLSFQSFLLFPSILLLLPLVLWECDAVSPYRPQRRPNEESPVGQGIFVGPFAKVLNWMCALHPDPFSNSTTCAWNCTSDFHCIPTDDDDGDDLNIVCRDPKKTQHPGTTYSVQSKSSFCVKRWTHATHSILEIWHVSWWTVLGD